jgi:L-asparaginase II
VEPIRVEVRRGATVESVHRVHAVAIRDGRLVVSAGAHDLVTFFRSSAKPFQALPLVTARDDLDESEVAIACASHQAEPAQLEAVLSLLRKARAGEEDLECGPQEGRPREPLYHNCSGKHAGFLALCRARGWLPHGYRLPAHPVQREALDAVAEAAAVRPEAVPLAVDGCGVVTFALTLEQMASAFSRLASLAGGGRVLGAMRARPELVGGEGASDTDLMAALPGWTAKRGAEGLFCTAAPDGLGVALRVEDGAQRAVRPALHRFLAELGFDAGEAFARVPVENSRGETVGEARAGGVGA